MCECDSTGRIPNKEKEEKGDWCYLKEKGCKLLTGKVVDWTWARCVWNNRIQVECPVEGNN